MLKAVRNYKRWGGRTFRFRLRNFRLDKNFYLRRQTITEAAFLLLLAYLTSKGLGTVRQVLFNSLFGTGPAATAYYVAFQLPDTIFNLIASGALVHAFVPVFLSTEKERGEQDVWRLTSLVFNVLLVTLTLLVLIAEFTAPQFVSNILAPGLTPAEKNLATTLTRIMLLQPLILGLGSIATAILHSKRRFLPSALAIAVYDVGLIGGMLVAREVHGVGIYGPTYGLLVSALLQVVVQVPALIKLRVRYSFTWNFNTPGFWQLLRLLGPNVLSLAIAAAASIVITSFASYLPDKASIAALHNASLLFTLPLTLIGLTVANALLPQITTYATQGRYVRMRATIFMVIGTTVALSIPVAVLMDVLGKPAIQILFQHGAFNGHSSALTNTALLGYSIGMPGQILAVLAALGFYALKDALTPLIANILALGAHISLLYLLLKVLHDGNAILIIPVAGGLAVTAQAVLLFLVLLIRLRARVKKDRGMERLRQRRRGERKRSKQLAAARPQFVPLDPSFLRNQVLQHIALMTGPSTELATILEMLNHIRSSLRGDGQRFYSPVVQEYEQAVAINPNNACLHFVLGQLHQHGNNYDRAIDAYMLASQHKTLEVIARVNAAQCLLRIGLPEVAGIQLEQALSRVQQDPGQVVDPRVWTVRLREEGEVLTAPEAEISSLLTQVYESKRRQEQMRVFLHSVSQTPSSYHEIAASPMQLPVNVGISAASGEGSGPRRVEARFNLSRPMPIDRPALHHSQGLYEEDENGTMQENGNSQDDLQVETMLSLPPLPVPGRLEPYDELADMYKIRGLLHKSIAELCEQAVDLLRNNSREQAGETLHLLSTMYAELGDTREALVHLQRAIELLPANQELLREANRYCLQLGLQADAARYQEMMALRSA